MQVSELMGKSKGQIVTIEAVRPLRRNELSKGNKDRTILKHSTHNSIWGVEFDNKKAVKEARENGDAPAENQGLKGKVWVSYPFVKRSLRTDKLALSVYPAKNGSKSTYTENGVEIGYQGYVDATIPSLHNRERTKLDTFDLTLESIVSIKVGGKKYAVAEDGEVTEIG
jgi:hypothetical protein